MSAHWTTTEDYILATEWPKGGLERCRPMLPRRTDTAIRARAFDKGLRITDTSLPVHRRKWTAEEEDFLRLKYPRHGIDWCAAKMPHRTHASVRVKVSSLGLKLEPDTLQAIRNNQVTERSERGDVSPVIVENTTAARALSMRW